MKLTTVTHVSVDGVMQGLGGSDEDRRGGFERGGWALPLFEGAAASVLEEAVGELKAEPGGELQVHGSGALIRWLFEKQLVDEMTLFTYPDGRERRRS